MIYTQFDRSNWVELGVNQLRLHCLLKALDYIVCLVEFGGHNLNDLHPIRPVDPIWGGGVKFYPPGQIRPGINYWSNWVEIH